MSWRRRPATREGRVASVLRAVIALLLAAGCGTSRTVEVPPTFDDHGLVVTLKPRVYVGILGMEAVCGTVENRTGHDVDLRLFLNLMDEKGAVVGYVHEFKPGFKNGAKQSFAAPTEPGQPRLFDFSLFAKPPPWSRVERGFAYDDRSVLGQAAYWFAVIRLAYEMHATARPE